MAYETSVGAAYAVLYSVLSIFTILAILTIPAISNKIPTNAKKFLCLSTSTSTESDYFLAARNSVGASAIALSFFASGMGAWVLYGSTELGALPEISWLGVIGYSFASAFPAVVISFLGPKIRDMTEGKDAFSTTDFAKVRYGRIMQVVVTGVSVFYMFIFIVAEMTSITVVYATMCNNFEKTPFMLSIILSLGIFTFFYTTLGGLPASIATDKFQGIIISILVVMLLISVTAVPENKITKEQFDKASNWTIDGFMVAVTLTIAILSAELFNQGTWQRVWAADSVSSMRKGFIIGSVLVFLLVFFFGVMGMIGYAKDSEFYDMGATFAFLSFFNILEPLSNFWHVMVLILVTALAASSVDSLQNAIACIFSSDFISLGWNPVLVSRILLVAVNVPAIFMSIQGYNVISLFLVADLVCATSVAPLFMGLQSNDIGMLPAPTELGALIGCIAGVVTVIVNGYVNKANGSGPFEYFWLRNNDQCSLCGSKTMITFIIVPIFSIVFTIIGSFIDIKLRGDRAREPLIMFSFDRHNENKEVSKTEKEDAPGVVSNDDTPNKANEVFDEEC